jgi:DNA-directed RNA polymerase I subunit RPA1
MWEHDDFIDVNKITSNDIAAVLKTYGVEAARNTIVNEINNVFDRYAISVSSRHLDLIGDMMTREGTYLAFNRQGIDSSTSAFMKMSYETTCQFLTKAVLDGTTEDLESPSAQIVVGKLSNVGTGSFDVLAKMGQ